MAIWMALTYFLSRWHKKWVSDYAVQNCLASDCVVWVFYSLYSETIGFWVPKYFILGTFCVDETLGYHFRKFKGMKTKKKDGRMRIWGF